MSTSTFAGLLSLKKVFFLEMFITALLYLLHLLLLLLPLLLWYFLQVRMKKTLQLPRGRSHLRHAWTKYNMTDFRSRLFTSIPIVDTDTDDNQWRPSVFPSQRLTRRPDYRGVSATFHNACLSENASSTSSTDSHDNHPMSCQRSKKERCSDPPHSIRLTCNIRAAKTATTRFSQIPRTARLSNRTAGTGRHLHSLFAKKGDYFEKSNPTRPEQHAQQPECLVRSRPPPLMPLRLPGAHDEMAMMYSSRV
ncbi:unnamed protein product [Mesocestoides corti]|uniref:Uncharacterized protein n=1 Tax=Mesocestoides corti TaxID=53468 RepID=A0A0R3UFF1_MESCO|nr:unnamed protein product [Mesocestoides corti]